MNGIKKVKKASRMSKTTNKKELVDQAEFSDYGFRQEEVQSLHFLIRKGSFSRSITTSIKAVGLIGRLVFRTLEKKTVRFALVELGLTMSVFLR